MDKKLLESMKGLSREERMAMIKSASSQLLDDSSLDSVNGGASYVTDEGTNWNPNSDIIPFKGNWISSRGYICDGEVVCF